MTVDMKAITGQESGDVLVKYNNTLVPKHAYEYQPSHHGFVLNQHSPGIYKVGNSRLRCFNRDKTFTMFSAAERNYLPTYDFKGKAADVFKGWISGGSLGGVAGSGGVSGEPNIDITGPVMTENASKWEDGIPRVLNRVDYNGVEAILRVGYHWLPELQLDTIKGDARMVVLLGNEDKTVRCYKFPAQTPINGIFKMGVTITDRLSVDTVIRVGLVDNVIPFEGHLTCGTRNYAAETLWGWVGTGMIDDYPTEEPFKMPSVNGNLFTIRTCPGFSRIFVSNRNDKCELIVDFDYESNLVVNPGHALRLQAFNKTWILTSVNPSGGSLELAIPLSDYNLWAGNGKASSIAIDTIEV